jgi:hypothetical protein
MPNSTVVKFRRALSGIPGYSGKNYTVPAKTTSTAKKTYERQARARGKSAEPAPEFRFWMQANTW